VFSPKDPRRDVLEITWNVLYWINFVLCWFIMPIMSTYLDTSEFTPARKLCYAIKLNLVIYAIGAGALIVYTLVFIFTENMELNFEKYQAVLMSLASSWAIVQIIIFISNGLISVPRMLFRRGNLHRRLRLICCKLVQVREITDDYHFEISKNLQKAHMAEMLVTPRKKKYIEEIYNMIPDEVASYEVLATGLTIEDPVKDLRSPKYSTIVKIHYKIKMNLHELNVYLE